MQVIRGSSVALFALSLLIASQAHGQVARVLDARGASVVERAGLAPRIIGVDEKLDQRDTIRVARDSHVILEFSDGSRMTLRPNTVFRVDAYRDRAPESVLAGLLKGGLRAEGGSAFDARLCEDECAREEQSRSAASPLLDPVARVVEIKGLAAAARAGGNARILVPGSAIYEREGIATGTGSYAVLVFSDGSRITLAERSRLAVLAYRFDDRQRTGIAELHHLSGVARVQSGAIAKQGPEYYRFFTPLGVLRPLGTGWDSVASGAKQVADKGADAARTAGETVVGAVQDTAGQAQQAALNAATAPIMQAMARLMHDLRNTPPATEAAASEMASRLTQLSSQLHTALDEVVSAAGAAANSPAFKTAVGLALAAELELYAVPAATFHGDPTGATTALGQIAYSGVRGLVAAAKAIPYQSESLALVGLSGADLDRVANDRIGANVIIAMEVGDHLASQGNTAAREFFAEAKSAAEAIQQRAHQAEAAATRAAAEAEQRAIEDAQRAAEEARDAEREAARKAEEAKQAAKERLPEGKAQAEVAADKAAQTGRNIVSGAIEGGKAGADAGADAGGAGGKEGSLFNPRAGESTGRNVGGIVGGVVGAVAGAGAAATGNPDDASAAGGKAGGAIGGEAGREMGGIEGSLSVGIGADPRSGKAGDVADQAADLGNSAAAKGREVADSAAQRGKETADAAGNAQPGNAMRAIEEIKSAEREFTRQVAELQRALDDAKHLTAEEKQRVRAALAEWARLVGEDVARKIAEVTSNPNAQVALTSLNIMGAIVATVAVTVTFGAAAIPLALLSLVAHTAMTNPSVFEGVPASVMAQATQGGEQAAQAMRSIVAAMVEHGKLGAGEAQQLLAALGQKLAEGKAEVSDAGKARAGAAGARAEKLLGVIEDYRAVDREADSADQRSLSVSVWDGSVEVAGRVVKKGELLRATASGQLVAGSGSSAPAGNAPRPDLVKVAGDLFGSSETLGEPRAIAGTGGGSRPQPGLYVWVRDGTIQLARDGKSVDVTAGNAVVATADKIAVLEAVPNFMRFDPTPQPANGAGSLVADAFRAVDGSFGSCKAR